MNNFWGEFAVIWSKIWDIINTPMTFGDISVSFVDIIILSGVVGVTMTAIHYIIYDD